MTDPPDLGPTRVLSFQSDYTCGHTGACCSSGWDIPVEPDVEDRIHEALCVGSLRIPGLPGVPEESDPFRAVPGLPHGARVVLRRAADGGCVFLDSGTDGRCAVHRRLGPGALASACRDFPRIVTLGPLGVSISLSHYCPTAAGLLFREDRGLSIVMDPPAFPRSWPYEGLDARASVGPLLRPDVLMGWEAHARWEEHAVETLAREDLSPGVAVALLSAQAEASRVWTPSHGPFDAHLDRCRAEEPGATGSPAADGEGPGHAWRLAAECVPEGHPLPEPPPAPGDESLPSPPVRRWLAAKAFASWLALQGEGLRTTVLGLRLALGVLRAETARDRGGAGNPRALREAFRRADLLLVHLADPTALASRLGRAERESGPPSPAW